VTDFGIAQVRSAEGVHEADQILGTPEFMSPEQASGKAVDHRSDLYSLGVVAFYMFSGRVPFSGRTVPAVLAQHIGKPPPRFASAAPGVPRGIAALVDQCLAKSPEDRVQKGEQVLAALAGTLEQRRELSPAVRVFINDRKAAETATAVTIALAPWLLIALMALIFSHEPLLTLLGVGILGALVGVPLLQTIHSARRLIKAGHARDEAVQGLEQEVEKRREELVHLFGKDFEAEARRFRWDAFGFLAFAALMIGGVFLESGGHALLLTGAALSAVIGAVFLHRSDKRTDRKGKHRLRLWRGAVGKALFELGGEGVDVRTVSPALTHRPTEVAIGMVVRGLFEALPKPLRSNLGDLPQVVRSLEADAWRMRENMKELDALLVDAPGTRLTSAGGNAESPDAARRVVELLRTTRAEAAERLAQAVAALEKLRLDLLKLRAGNISVAGVTANLGEARELSAQVRRLLAGMEEVQRTLARK
jgi:serine/threonine-protein kinase